MPDIFDEISPVQETKTDIFDEITQEKEVPTPKEIIPVSTEDVFDKISPKVKEEKPTTTFGTFGTSTFFERLGKAAAMQAQITPPPEIIPQATLGTLEEISLGMIDLMPAKTEAGKFARGVGKYGIAFPFILKRLGTLLSPLGPLGRMLGFAGAGAYRSGVKQYFKKGEIDLKEVGKEGAIWGGLQAIGEVANVALQTKQAIDFISRTSGKSKPEVARFLSDAFKKRFKQRFKINPTEKNITILGKSKPTQMAETWEGAIKDVKATEIKPIEKPPIVEVPKVPKVAEETERLKELVTFQRRPGDFALDFPKVNIPNVTAAKKVLNNIFPVYDGNFEKLRIYYDKTKLDPYSAVIGMPSHFRFKDFPMTSNFTGSGKTREEAVENLASQIYKTRENFASWAPEKRVKPPEKEVPKVPKVTEELPRTEGKGVQYHGSPTEIKKFEEVKDITIGGKGYEDIANFYGEGFYTTDSLRSADTYAKTTRIWKKGGKPLAKIQKDKQKPTLYKIKEKKPLKLYDIQQPMDSNLKEKLKKIKIDGMISEIARKITDDPKQTLQEIYNKVRKAEIGQREIQEEFTEIKKVLSKEGYNGLQFKEGGVSDKIDQQKIYFNPEKDIEIIKLPSEKEIPKVAKPPTPPPTKPPTPPAPPMPPTKPSGEEPAVPGKITEGTAKYFSNLAAKFDVEYPFKKVGAPETGFRIKNYYDRINFHIEKAKIEIKKIDKLGLTKEQLSDAVLAAEKAEIPKDPKVKTARAILRKYMDNSLIDLKKEGVLKKGFHERLLDSIKMKIKANNEISKISKPKQKIKLAQENRELQQEAKEVAKLRFVSIPVRELFEAHTMGNPALTKKVVQYLTKKRRKTLTMQDLVDSGAIEKKDLTPKKIIESYSKKFGRDMALAKIINAAKIEGLVSSTEELGMVKIPGYIAPELAKYWVSPTFADFLKGYTSPRTFSNWEKLANRTKGWSFYNPLVLGFNNLWQQVFGVLGQPQNLTKLSPAWKQAVLDVKNKTPNYWEAFENGIRSSPMVTLEKNIGALTESLKKDGPNPLLSMIKTSLKYPKAVHDKLYDAMQTMAWTGGDMVPRMATYNWLRSIGLSPRDAAQTAASIHGDYASVPIDLRRKLNKFIYVPTFPIVMTKLLIENIKNATKVAKIFYKRAKGEKTEKIDPKTKAKASGLLGATIILGGTHLTMKALGFDTVFPLWHYKRDYRDEKGKLQTQHVYLSFPLISIWKQIGRVYESFSEKGVENRILRLAKKLKINLSIPIQTLWEILENKTRSWENVYDKNAPIYKQAMDILSFIAKRSLPIIGIPLGERFADPKRREENIKEFGLLMDMVPFIFTFKSDTDRKKAKRKVTFLKREMKRLKKKKKLTPKEIENYKKVIKELKEVK